MNNYERCFPPESIFIHGRSRRGVVQVGGAEVPHGPAGVTRSLLSPHIRLEAGGRLAQVCLPQTGTGGGRGTHLRRGVLVQRGHILEWKGRPIRPPPPPASPPSSSRLVCSFITFTPSFVICVFLIRRENSQNI